MHPTFVDIETMANEALFELLPEVKPPSSYKKPESIAKWYKENGDIARQEQIAKMPLDPLLFQLRAIGLASGPDAEPEVLVIRDEAEERAALTEFWSRLNQRPATRIVGYNIVAFDLPRILWRSTVLDIEGTRPLNLDRYGRGDVLDLLLLLKNFDNRTTSLIGMGFKTVCERLNIPNPLPGVDGSQVATMTDDEIAAYNANELRMLQALYQRMSGRYFHNAATEGPPF